MVNRDLLTVLADHLLKTKKEFKNFKETGARNCIYKNELDKVCFQHDMACVDFKDLTRRTASDKVLRDKTFNIAKNLKYDGYQRGLASMIYKFFDKIAAGSSVNTHANKSAFSNEKLPEELQKLIIIKIKKRTVYSRFKDNIWGAELVDMQLISKFNKRFRYLLWVIDIFSKYAWVVSLKDKKCVSIVNTSQEILKKYQAKYRLTIEVNFTTVLLKNG